MSTKQTRITSAGRAMLARAIVSNEAQISGKCMKEAALSVVAKVAEISNGDISVTEVQASNAIKAFGVPTITKAEANEENEARLKEALASNVRLADRVSELEAKIAALSTE